EFGEIINEMEQKTEALVIDQLHNFGGIVDYQYELASIFAIEPLKTPYHRVKISQREVMQAVAGLEMIKLLETVVSNPDGISLNFSKTDPFGSVKSSEKETQEEEEKSEKEEDDQPLFNFQQLMFLKSYFELIIEDWNNGLNLSRPTPILGIDRINP